MAGGIFQESLSADFLGLAQRIVPPAPRERPVAIGGAADDVVQSRGCRVESQSCEEPEFTSPARRIVNRTRSSPKRMRMCSSAPSTAISPAATGKRAARQVHGFAGN